MVWIVIIAALSLLIAAAWLLSVKDGGVKDSGAVDAASRGAAVCSSCPAAACPLKSGAKTPLETDYFDDEELDRYRGRPSDAYSDDEAEEFRYVLETMAPEEAPLWEKSLERRGVSLPAQLKDELMMRMGKG